jgi:predicted transcriptional regulator
MELKYNLQKSYNKYKYKPEIIEKAIDEYLVSINLSTYEIAQKYNIHYKTLLHVLRKNNLTLKTKTIMLRKAKNKIKNSDFFDKIDTEEKAYWLGFLLADGNLHKNRRYIRIDLCTSDKEHLKKFANIFNQKVIDRIRTRKNKICYESYVNFSNIYVWESLYNVGLRPNKTLVPNENIFEKIPIYLINHFIRGNFDGDGCAFRNLKSIMFCGDYFYIEKLSNFFHINLNIEKKKIYYRKNYALIIYAIKEAIIIRDYMYHNSSIYLERKKEIIDKIKFKRYF